MNKFLKAVLYSSLIKRINRLVLSLFYDKKYLQGKFFDEQRYGFVWAWRGIFRSIMNRRRGIRWPISKGCRIPNGLNIIFDPSSLNVFQQPGTYFQSFNGKITIGRDVWIAQNVGIITENHNPTNPDNHLPAKDVFIGDGCWVGMNAVVLPGVTLGNHTTVGAGSIVTHSFPGNCVIAGNPAKIIRQLNCEEQ